MRPRGSLGSLEPDAQNLIDTSANFAMNNGRFALFGRTLSDEDGYNHGYDVAGLWSYAAVKVPRIFGVEAMTSW